jgi:hypothetical protein
MQECTKLHKVTFLLLLFAVCCFAETFRGIWTLHKYRTFSVWSSSIRLIMQDPKLLSSSEVFVTESRAMATLLSP